MQDIKNKKNKDRFLELLRSVKRDGILELIDWLESSDFFTAPASTRYHGSFPGGLLAHSLLVFEELNRVLKAYPEIEVGEDSVIIASLLHDVCKANFYTTEKRNRKDKQGRWESYDFYTVKEKLSYGGHGSKSVYISSVFIKLTLEEAVAINCHMGAYDNENVGSSYEQFPFAWALHVADEAATYIRENVEDDRRVGV